MNKTKLIRLLVIATLQFVILIIFKNSPQLVENVYSNGLYPFISKLMRYTFGWVPFSVGDMIYLLVIIYALRWLILNGKRIWKDFANWLIDVATALVIAYSAFLMLWGYNYYRIPLSEQLELKTEYTTEALIDLTQKLIERSNYYQLQITNNDTVKVEVPYGKKEIYNKLTQGYNKLSLQYPYFKYQPHSIKSSLVSLGLTYMGFSGYINPFTNEAQVNNKIPIYKFPTTACHEVAHQIGYAAENEANFIGALAAIANDDMYFKYAGYSFALRYCLADLERRNPEIYTEIIKDINLGVIKNYVEAREFWLSYQNPFQPFFEGFMDNFLKANNQAQGMDSYNYVVDLLVNYYSDKAL